METKVKEEVVAVTSVAALLLLLVVVVVMVGPKSEKTLKQRPQAWAITKLMGGLCWRQNVFSFSASFKETSHKTTVPIPCCDSSVAAEK
jgi:hypothetical protein